MNRVHLKRKDALVPAPDRPGPPEPGGSPPVSVMLDVTGSGSVAELSLELLGLRGVSELEVSADSEDVDL